ncbi:MAG: hypothetical protein U9N56_04185 [Actinomycetota bacterium]|nr:hypothetical protein [Actinomycetota bacterium]
MNWVSGSPDPWELLHRYHQRYDVADQLEPALRLEHTVDRRKARANALHRRVDELQRQLADTHKELVAVKGEIEGSRRTVELFLSEVLDDIRRSQGEAWSPTPIYGFRMWAVRQDGLHGAMVRWREPRLTSECLNQIPGEDVPHSVRICGSPACGIYATKSLAVLRQELGVSDIDGYVIAVVALSGKVVEHEHGYRAARAEVVAVAGRLGGRHIFTDDPETITDFFARPSSTLVSVGKVGKPDGGETDRFLNEWKENQDKWTWDEKSAS